MATVMEIRRPIIRKLVQMIKTDYHCHVLPAMDDGAEDIETSCRMLDMMSGQGIENIVLTPHFYPHREKSVQNFLERREKSFSEISDRNFHFRLGAEVAIERGICENPDIKELAIQGTSLILLELPFNNVGRWAVDEVHNITCETGLRPVLAHIHRYTKIFSRDDFNSIMNLNAVMQVNIELLHSFSGRLFLSKLIKSGAEIVFGSDSHNLTDRKPDYMPLKKYIKTDILTRSDSVLEKYSI